MKQPALMPVGYELLLDLKIGNVDCNEIVSVFPEFGTTPTNSRDWLAVVRSQGAPGPAVKEQGKLPDNISHYGSVCAAGDTPTIALKRLAMICRKIADSIDEAVSKST